MSCKWKLLSLATGLAALAAPVLASPPAPVQARSAADFLDSIGVNTHLGATSTGSLGTSYGNPLAIKRELEYTGIKHVRDDMGIGTHLSALQQLNSSLGVKFDLVYGYYASDGGSVIISADLANLQDQPTIIEAIEGPNEPDWFGLYYDGSNATSAIKQSQEFLYKAVKENAFLHNAQVYCPAFSYPGNSGKTSSVGNLSAFCDEAPLHAYVDNHSLGVYLPYDFIAKWASLPNTITAIGRPEVITEFGWSTASNGGGVDETSQAKYIPVYLLDAFSQGISRSYIYELSDDFTDPTLTNTESNYGLFHFGGEPKPAAVVLANLNLTLESNRFTPTSLSYSIDCMPRSGRHILLEKSNGSFVLALWNEANLFDETNHVEVPLELTQVLVSLGAPASKVEIIDPSDGPSLLTTYSNVAGFIVKIPDHVILAVITP